MKVKRVCLLAAALAFAAAAAPTLRAQDRDPAEAALYVDAANAQKGGAIPLATDLWKEYLTKYPKGPMAHHAQHYLGVCLMQLEQPKYKEAADAFAVIVAAADQQKDFPHNEDAYFNLGSCWFNLAGQEKDAQAAAAHYVRAAETLGTLVQKYPEYKLNDQALFYQGESLYMQGKPAAAIAPYQKLIADYDESGLRADALYALGVAHQDLKQHQQAGAVYDQFLKEIPPENKFTNEVRMRKAETQLDRGIALRADDKAGEAAPLIAAAEKTFAEVAEVEGFSAVDVALYRQALCAALQEQYVKAADLYVSLVTDHKDSPRAAESRMRAGRNYYLADRLEDAADWFEEVYNAGGADAPEAAHLLAKIRIKQNKPGDAAALAAEALAKAEGAEIVAQLLFVQADALYAIPERRAESLPLYLKVATDHPSDSLAPSALYYAAHTALDLKKFDEGVTHAQAFLEKYPDDKLTPDVKYVVAECNMLAKKYDAAETGYADLIGSHAGHADVENWRVRLGECLYVQKKYAEAIAALAPHVDEMKSPAGKAQALFFIGYGHFAAEKYDEAEKTLAASLAADDKSFRADEALLVLSRARHEQGKTAQAIADAKTLIADYPQSRFLDQAHFRLADYSYAAGDYKTAAAENDAVIANWPDSPFTPHARYNKGWSHFNQEEWPEAIAAFTDLIEKHPEHELVEKAVFSRGMAARRSGDAKAAVAQLTEYLKGSLSKEQKSSARYELGVALMDVEDNAAAATTFEALLKEDPDYKFADKVLYELAWSHRGQGKEEEAVARFAELAKSHPESAHAAEAQSHVGLDLYKQKKYAEAQEAYRNAKEKALAAKQDAVLENCTYMLGLACYNAEQFDAALAEFAEQVQKFKKGPQFENGLFMRAECLYKLDKFQEALPAYLEANRAAAESEKLTPAIQALILLHGGQSAGQLDKWQESLDLLSQIPEKFEESPYLAEAHYEIGRAQENLNKPAEAMAAYDKAAALAPTGVVGARARFMMGELDFGAKRYDEAIRQFQRVVFGFGGEKAPDEIKPWQAKSGFESGRCCEVRVEAAEGDARAKLIADARKYYTYVVEKHPQDKLAETAKQRLAVLSKL